MSAAAIVTVVALSVVTGSRAGSAQPTLALSVAPTSVSSGEAARATAKYHNPAGGTTTQTVVTFTFSPAVDVLDASAGCTPSSGPAVASVSCQLGNVQGGTAPIPVRVSFIVTEPVSVEAQVAWAEAGPGGPKKAVNSVINSVPAKVDVGVLLGSTADAKNGCADSLSTTGLGPDNIVQTLVSAASEAAALCTPIEIQETSVVGQNLDGNTIACGGQACTTAPSYAVFSSALGTLTLTFYFPPPGSAPRESAFALYRLDDGSDTSGDLVPPCGSPAVPDCVVIVEKLDNRTLRVVVQVSGTGVDPGFIG